MADYVVRATAAGGTVRAFAAVTTDTVRKAADTHGLSPVASAALGRVLTAAAIMSRSLKNERDSLTIQIKGDGPLGGIVVVSDWAANVKGYVYNPNVYLPLNSAGKLNVADAIGKHGYLNVIKDLGLKEPYIGYVNLVSGEIAEDIAYYYAYSEQVPSVVALGVLVDADEKVLNAGGFMIQLMPGAEEGVIDYLENRVKSISPVTKLLSGGKSAEQILESVMGEIGVRIIDSVPCRYQCGCSREKMERGILSLGKDEIASLIEEQDGAEVQCHFCNSKYRFTKEELMELLYSAK